MLITGNSSIFIFSFSLLGAFLSGYIWQKKQQGKPLICPIGSNCNDVVSGKFSKFWGIPIEKIGLAYYGSIFLFYLGKSLFSIQASSTVEFWVVATSFLALLFSIYLTFIQLVTLRKICTWCLSSLFLSVVIFLLSIQSAENSIFIFTETNETLFIFLHLLGFAVGVGGVTITDVFFFRFLKDFKISESEANILHILSQVIWFALGLIVFSGIGLFLPRLVELLESAKFLLKMTVVGVIFLNGLLLNLVIAPKLIEICFGGPHRHGSKNGHHGLRQIAVALGAISLVSWYIAIFLGMLPSIPIDYWEALAIYLWVVLVAIVGSQIADQIAHA